MPILHRDEAHERLFGVNVQLAAEPAADLGSDHAQAVLFQAQHQRHQRPHQVGDLRGRVQGQGAIAGTPVGHHAARFHRSGDEALAGDALLDNHLGLGERLIDITVFLVVFVSRIVGPFRMHRWRIGRDRLFRIRHGGERLVFHFDQFGGVTSDVAIRGNDDRHGMANEVHAVGRQDMMRRNTQARKRRAARHQTDLFGVLAGEHRGDAGQIERRLNVDRLDFRGAVRAAHDAGVMHAGHLNVVHVGGCAGDQPRVLAPANPFADERFRLGDGCGHAASVTLSPRQPSPHSQYAGSRCSGTSYLLSRAGSLFRWAVGFRSTICLDVMIMPGVQKPHCSACSFQKAS